jgi:hypothetical protein
MLNQTPRMLLVLHHECQLDLRGHVDGFALVNKRESEFLPACRGAN